MPSKADKIKATLQATRQRRSHQRCLVYELKVDRSDLPASTIQRLNRLFAEAKWFYNACLARDHPTDFDDKARSVEVRVGDHDETRDLLVLSSQMKQGMKARLTDALRSLAALKRQGRKVGALKFKRFVHSIPLKQAGSTYRLLDGKHVAIQNIPVPIKVFGLHQPQGAEIANANLIRRGRDFYLMVTCFRERERSQPKPFSTIGLDFNVSAGNQIVLSNEVAIGFSVPVSCQVKREQRRLAHQDRKNRAAGRTKHTRNRHKARERLQRAHHRQDNHKRELRNQILHRLNAGFEQVVVQTRASKAGRDALAGRSARLPWAPS